MTIKTNIECVVALVILIIVAGFVVYAAYLNFALVAFLATYLIPIVGGCSLCVMTRNVCQVIFGKYFYHRHERHSHQ